MSYYTQTVWKLQKQPKTTTLQIYDTWRAIDMRLHTKTTMAAQKKKKLQLLVYVEI